MSTLPPKWAIPLSQQWSVIPVRARDKRPAIARWKEYQSVRAAPDTVAKWASNDALNVGIVTGRVSGLIVLDLDNADAIAEAQRRGLPETVTAKTGKGRHVYFRHTGEQVPNRAGLFPGADLRGDGGYVVAPGSVHSSGAVYKWIAAPPATHLADPPAWLLDALEPQRPDQAPQRPQEARRARSQPMAGDCTSYGRAALERESEAIRCAVNGEQEKTLNAAALKVGALVAGKELARDFARRELVRAGLCMANHDAGNLWTLNAITAKVDRALEDGAACPRSAPEMQGVRHG